jgi:hypothetical protein
VDSGLLGHRDARLVLAVVSAHPSGLKVRSGAVDKALRGSGDAGASPALRLNPILMDHGQSDHMITSRREAVTMVTCPRCGIEAYDHTYPAVRSDDHSGARF